MLHIYVYNSSIHMDIFKYISTSTYHCIFTSFLASAAYSWHIFSMQHGERLVYATCWHLFSFGYMHVHSLVLK